LKLYLFIIDIELSNEIDPTNQGLQTNGLVEGDIIADYDEDSSGNKSYNAVSSDELLWKDGIVPYTISDAFSNKCLSYLIFV